MGTELHSYIDCNFLQVNRAAVFLGFMHLLFALLWQIVNFTLLENKLKASIKC